MKKIKKGRSWIGVFVIFYEEEEHRINYIWRRLKYTKINLKRHTQMMIMMKNKQNGWKLIKQKKGDREGVNIWKVIKRKVQKDSKN